MRALTIAWFIGLLVTAAVDASSPILFPLLVAGPLVSLMPFLASELVGAFLARRWSVSARLWWALVVVATGVVPVWGAVRCIAVESLRAGLALSALTWGAGVFVAYGVTRLGRDELRIPFLLSVCQLAAFFVEAHFVESTLGPVRPGTEWMRLGMFFGMWGASLALSPGWMFRVSDAVADDVMLRFRVRVRQIAATAVRALSGFGGLVLVIADRYVFEGLYPGYHNWMLFVGLCSISVALVPAVKRLLPEGGRPVAWGVALASLIVAPVVWVFVSSAAVDPLVRSAIDDARVAPLVLRLREAEPLATGLEEPEHAALEYDRRLDDRPPMPRPNIVLISVDTLRSDWVGPTVENAGNTPRIDELIEESAWFPRGYAPGNRTAVSMSALHLGLYSANIEWNLFIWKAGRVYDPAKMTELQRQRLGDDWGYTTVPTFPHRGTLAERLKRAGYATMGRPYVKNDAFFRKGLGFERGYDVYDNSAVRGTTTSMPVVRSALKQVDARPADRPFFQWIHLFDPHEGKARPDSYRPMIVATDEAIGAYVDGLRERGLWDSTMLVIVSDHGEAFGEHGFRFHGHSLYDEQILVPVIVRVPGASGRTTDLPVSVLDVVPTMLIAAEADVTETDGVNLLPFVFGEALDPDRPVFSEMHRYRGNSGEANRDAKAVIVGHDKLIYNRKKEWVKLFDVGSDPDELENLSVERFDRTRELLSMLVSWVNPRERARPLPNIEPPR